MNSIIGLSKNTRTIASGKLSRTISLSEMHHKLMAMFVNRLELQDKSIKKSKQDWIDKGLSYDNEFMMQENCWLMHMDWNEFERLAKMHNWEDLFIEDEKGGNNAW